MFVFFFNDTATTEIYTLSLHDALPISVIGPRNCTQADLNGPSFPRPATSRRILGAPQLSTASTAKRRPFRSDRKSTRLNSSHANISYAVFCLKKKKTTILLRSSRQH